MRTVHTPIYFKLWLSFTSYFFQIIDKLLDKDINQLFKAPSFASYLTSKASASPRRGAAGLGAQSPLQPPQSRAARLETRAAATQAGASGDAAAGAGAVGGAGANAGRNRQIEPSCKSASSISDFLFVYGA